MYILITCQEWIKYFYLKAKLFYASMNILLFSEHIHRCSTGIYSKILGHTFSELILVNIKYIMTWEWEGNYSQDLSLWRWVNRAAGKCRTWCSSAVESCVVRILRLWRGGIWRFMPRFSEGFGKWKFHSKFSEQESNINQKSQHLKFIKIVFKSI